MVTQAKAAKELITSGQIRAARGLLGWPRERLAEASGVPMRTLARLESGEGKPHAAAIKATQKTLEDAGISFIPEDRHDGPGVRFATPKGK